MANGAEPQNPLIPANTNENGGGRLTKLINGALEDLTAITGQKPQLRRVKKSIANFKLREGMPIGARVTLRGELGRDVACKAQLHTRINQRLHHEEEVRRCRTRQRGKELG